MAENMMTTNDQQKIALFEQDIMNEVKVICDGIHEEIEAFRKQELASYEDNLLEHTYSTIQSQVSRLHTDSTLAVSQKKNEMKKALYEKREGYTKLLFAKVRAGLSEFVSSGEYLPFLLAKVEKLAQAYSFSDAVLYVREEDMQYQEQLLSSFGRPCKVEKSAAIHLGGVMLKSQAGGSFVDETLEAKLLEQKEWFTANSGLTITL